MGRAYLEASGIDYRGSLGCLGELGHSTQSNVTGREGATTTAHLDANPTSHFLLSASAFPFSCQIIFRILQLQLREESFHRQPRLKSTSSPFAGSLVSVRIVATDLIDATEGEVNVIPSCSPLKSCIVPQPPSQHTQATSFPLLRDNTASL